MAGGPETCSGVQVSSESFAMSETAGRVGRFEAAWRCWEETPWCASYPGTL